MISKKTDKCPICGKKQNNIGFTGAFILIFFVIGFSAMIMKEKNKNQVVENPTPIVTVEQKNKNKEIVNKIAPYIQEWKNNGLISYITTNTTSPRIYVTDEFINSSYQDKLTVSQMLYAYYSITNNQTDIFIYYKDSKTNKEIGLYTPRLYGMEPSLDWY